MSHNQYLTIQEFKLRQELSLANLEKSKEWWLPTIYAGTTIHQLWGNAMNGNGIFFNDVNRQNFWGGVGLNATWNFGDGIFKSNAAKFKTQAAVYKTQSEQNKALLNIINIYYDFISAQLYYKSYEQLSAQADSITFQISVQVEAGLQYESELLLAKSNHNHLKVTMLNARTEYNNMSALLIKSLNLDPNIKLLSSENVIVPLNLIDINALETSFDSTYQVRPELKSMELILQSLNEEKKTTTTSLLLPEVRIGGYSSFFGDVFSPIDPTSELNASLIWKIPMGRLTKKGTLLKYNAQITLQENQIAQAKAIVNKELITSREQIKTANEQTEIALEGSQLAKKALKQCIERQRQGIVRPFEILQAQEIYIKSMLDYLEAIASYNKAQYAYYVATGNNL